MRPPDTRPPVPTTWREQLARWPAEDRFAWEERVAIMIEGAGLSVDEAERLGFSDVSLYRSRR